MDINEIIAQYSYGTPQLLEYQGFPIISMPTALDRYRHCYGKIRMAVVLSNFPAVLAFIKSDGNSVDPGILSEEEIEAVHRFLLDTVRYATESNSQTTTDSTSLTGS